MTSPFSNIAEAVDYQAKKNPDQIAIYFPEKVKNNHFTYSHYSFAELSKQTHHYAQGFLSFGFKPGDKIALMVTPSLEFFALTFALFKANLVPILIDPGIGLKNLKECLKEASPVGFIGVPKAQLARIILRWARGSIKKVINVGGFLLPGTSLKSIKRLGSEANIKISQNSIEDHAAMIFTSGSTGVPKGVLYTHQNFLTQIRLIKEKYNLTEGDIDLPTFPLFALFNAAFGMTSVIPKMDFTKPGSVNPNYIIQPILDFKIDNMFGSPALLNRVGRHASENNIKLPSLKRILSAGAPVNPKIIRLFDNVLNNSTQIFTPYGATESLPVASIGSNKILNKAEPLTALGKGVCVGETFDEVQVKIIKISDEPILKWDTSLECPLGEPGEIITKGSNVTRAYFNRPKANSLGKINDGNEFWHRMGDIGYFDASGDLWFLGRKSHRVILKDQTLFTIAVEGVFNAHDSVFRTALVGIDGKDQVRPVLCVELEKNISNPDQVLKDLKETALKFDHTKMIKDFLIHPSFPVDIRHNAKIFREKLKPWAEEQL